MAWRGKTQRDDRSARRTRELNRDSKRGKSETHSIRTVTEEMHLVSREESHDSLMGEEIGELEGVAVRWSERRKGKTRQSWVLSERREN